MPDKMTLLEELRQQAAEAIRIAATVPEGTRAALQKLAADLLAAAADLEAAATVVVATDEAITETKTATHSKTDT